ELAERVAGRQRQHRKQHDADPEQARDRDQQPPEEIAAHNFIRRRDLLPLSGRSRGETPSAPRAHHAGRKIWAAARPSPASLRSPPSPAVQERDYDGFTPK